MKKATLFVLVLASLSCFSQTLTFHDFSGKTILGDPLYFSTFYGKKVMVVNTATYCSWVDQYEDLESLYTQYRDSNFMIIGFPCNDFGFQEPSNDSTINEFCTDVYGIEFQMMSKVTIIGQDTAAVYKWLQEQSQNGVEDASVTWNFNKFLIDEAGHWVAHYTQQTSPFDTAIINWLKTPSVIDTIDTSSSTGIRSAPEIKMTNEIASDRLTISFQNLSHQNTTVLLYSASGQLLSTLHDGLLTAGEEVTADIGSLSNGIYFVRANNEKGSGVLRFSVIR